MNVNLMARRNRSPRIGFDGTRTEEAPASRDVVHDFTVVGTPRRVGVLAAVCVALALMTASASPAGAATYPQVYVVSYSNAPIGVTYPGETRCATVDPYSGVFGGVLHIAVDAPTVYARNLTSGVDYQYVAHRPILRDRTTNQIVTWGTWSSWTLATDSTPARWATATQYASSFNTAGLDARHVYASQTEVWWYNANGTISKVVVELAQYRQLVYQSGSLLSSTIQPSCRRI